MTLTLKLNLFFFKKNLSFFLVMVATWPALLPSDNSYRIFAVYDVLLLNTNSIEIIQCMTICTACSRTSTTQNANSFKFYHTKMSVILKYLPVNIFVFGAVVQMYIQFYLFCRIAIIYTSDCSFEIKLDRIFLLCTCDARKSHISISIWGHQDQNYEWENVP